jgi:pyruvate/2-oxoacid:ferredoxin oxidoreductase beta subunit
MDSSIAVCRQAVRTNYFPLWECDNGEYRITQKVSKPKPVGELTRMLGKFKHLSEEQLAVLQQQSDRRFEILNALCESSK